MSRLSCCCDWGFGVSYARAEGDTTWYIGVVGGSSASNGIVRYDKGDGSQISFKSEDDLGTFARSSEIIDSQGNTYNPTVRRYNFFDETVDSLGKSADAIAVDPDGNVYVALSEFASPTNTLVVEKYDSTFSLVWRYTKSPPDPGGSDTARFEPVFIDVGQSGEVHVLGNHSIFNGAFLVVYRDTIEIRVNSNGSEKWSIVPTSDSDIHKSGVMCRMDEDDNVICCYDPENLAGGIDSTTLQKFDADGNLDFSHSDTEFPYLLMFFFFQDRLYASVIATDKAKFSVYSGSEFLTEDWTQEYSEGAGETISKARLAVDESGDMFATYTLTDNTGDEGLRIRLDGSNGNEVYNLTRNGSETEYPMIPPGPPVQFIE